MFLDKDLLGRQEDIELFSNIGCLDTFEGRLTVWLSINQTPRVRWEFEVARGDYTFDALSLDTPPNKLTSWDGSNPQLVVENPIFTYRGGRRRQGYAKQVLYGDVGANAHYFDFYIPNTDFIREATGDELEAITEALGNESFKVEIGNDWSIEIFTVQEVLNWLKPKKQNRGSMITLKMCLFQTKQASTGVRDLEVKSLMEAKQLISNLCLMLSYANGGYVQPVYVIANKFVETSTEQIIAENVAALAEAPLISPQEELGQGFIRSYGIKDLLNFIKCFPSFQRMLQTPHWREKWLVILEWYFQAIPKLSGRRRNALLPVVANALGTLLENIAKLILVDEEPNPTQRKTYKKSNAEGRIKELLNRIGISGEDTVVKNFVAIRNNSTHAKTTSIPLTDRQQWEVVLRAVQWVDEALLWRLGYEGQYRERNLSSDQGIEPRYDLSRRDSSW
jgi:hypothetical protein